MGRINSKKFTLKSGEEVIIRHGEKTDAVDLLNITRSVMEEREYVITKPEEFTITEEKEKEWIRSFLDNEGKILIVAEVSGEIIGWLSFQNQQRYKLKHTGEFGITTRKGWRDKGVGRIIITELLDWAEKNPIIKKVCLGVFSNNKRAIHLYKSLGFEEEGYRKQHIRISEDEYLDDILMYKFVK